MVLVGTFSEQDMAAGKDKAATQQKKDETGLQYTQTKFVKKGGKVVGLKIWVCSADEFTL